MRKVPHSEVHTKTTRIHETVGKNPADLNNIGKVIMAGPQMLFVISAKDWNVLIVLGGAFGSQRSLSSLVGTDSPLLVTLSSVGILL